MKSKFFFFGHFDPFTRVDFNVVVAQMADNDVSGGIIAIDVDYNKPSLFSVKKREEMIEESLKWYDKQNKTDYASRIKVVSFSGVPAYAAVKYEADILITLENHHKAVVSCDIARNLLNYRLNIDEMSFIMDCDYMVDETDVYTIVKYLYAHKEYITLQKYLTPAVHNMVMIEALKNEYQECCRGSYIPWEDFVKEVGSREYHNLSHIAYMLNKYRFYKEDVFDKEQHFQNLNFKAAIFFHDYVLNDEEMSFKYSRLSALAKGLFMATKHGDGAPDNLGKQEQLIRDLDLAILTDACLYQDYQAAIRMEYADVADDVYAENRIKVLDSLLGEIKDAKIFSENEKNRAFKNINAEKKKLQKQLMKLKLRKFFSRK